MDSKKIFEFSQLVQVLINRYLDKKFQNTSLKKYQF